MTTTQLQPARDGPKRWSWHPGLLLLFFTLFMVALAWKEHHKLPYTPPPGGPGSWTSATSPAASATSPAANAEVQPETWRTDLVITKKSWPLSEFSVATWKITVKNTSRSHVYKDPHFKTRYWGRSGTLIDESFFGHTEYRLLSPGQTIQITFTEFTHSQAASAAIEIDGAIQW